MAIIPSQPSRIFGSNNSSENNKIRCESSRTWHVVLIRILSQSHPNWKNKPDLAKPLKISSFRFQPTVISGYRFSTWDWNAGNETFVVETSHSIIYWNSSHEFFWHGTKLHVWWRQARLVPQGKRNLKGMTWMVAAVKWLRKSNCYEGSLPCRSSWLKNNWWILKVLQTCKNLNTYCFISGLYNGWRQQFLVNNRMRCIP